MIREALLPVRMLVRPRAPTRAAAPDRQAAECSLPAWKRTLAATLSATSFLTASAGPLDPWPTVRSAQGPYSNSLDATLAGLSPFVGSSFSRQQAVMLAKATELPGVLGEVQALRAARIYSQLDAAQVNVVDRALQMEPDDAHRVFVWKDLGAANPPSSVLQFAEDIRALPSVVLTDQLSLGDAQQHQTGLAQATLETVKGDANPEYALQVHARDGNVHVSDTSGTGLGTNPFIAQEQRDWLQQVGGVAKPRGEGGAGSLDARVVWLTPNLQRDTGYTYTYRDINQNDPKQVSDALDALARQLRFGLQTFFRVTDGKGMNGHFAEMLDVQGEGPGQVFSYHDVWSGETKTTTRAAILSNTFNIAGWDHLGGYATPLPAGSDVPPVPPSS